MVFYRLEAADGVPDLVPHLRVIDGHLERRLREARERRCLDQAQAQYLAGVHLGERLGERRRFEQAARPVASERSVLTIS